MYINPRNPITSWEWQWNLKTMLRRWLDTPIIIGEYDWMPREIYTCIYLRSIDIHGRWIDQRNHNKTWKIHGTFTQTSTGNHWNGHQNHKKSPKIHIYLVILGDHPLAPFIAPSRIHSLWTSFSLLIHQAMASWHLHQSTWKVAKTLLGKDFTGEKRYPWEFFLNSSDFSRCRGKKSTTNHRDSIVNSARGHNNRGEGAISHRILGSLGKSPRNSYISGIFWDNFGGIPYCQRSIGSILEHYWFKCRILMVDFFQQTHRSLAKCASLSRLGSRNWICRMP